MTKPRKPLWPVCLGSGKRWAGPHLRVTWIRNAQSARASGCLAFCEQSRAGPSGPAQLVKLIP
jgi:hypothetical protein